MSPDDHIIAEAQARDFFLGVGEPIRRSHWGRSCAECGDQLRQDEDELCALCAAPDEAA